MLQETSVNNTAQILQPLEHLETADGCNVLDKGFCTDSSRQIIQHPPPLQTQANNHTALPSFPKYLPSL